MKYASDDVLRTMEDSLVRKNEIYSKVDPYALQSAQSEEEERFMERSGELKDQVLSSFYARVRTIRLAYKAWTYIR